MQETNMKPNHMGEKIAGSDLITKVTVNAEMIEYKGYTLRKVGPFSNCYTFLCSNGDKKLCSSLTDAKKYVDYLAAPTVYKIVQTVSGRMVTTQPKSIRAWAYANGRAVYTVARVARLRPELRCQPRIEGLCGPMWDGLNHDGQPVIRYEDQATYDTLSA